MASKTPLDWIESTLQNHLKLLKNITDDRPINWPPDSFFQSMEVLLKLRASSIVDEDENRLTLLENKVRAIESDASLLRIGQKR